MYKSFYSIQTFNHFFFRKIKVFYKSLNITCLILNKKIEFTIKNTKKWISFSTYPFNVSDFRNLHHSTPNGKRHFAGRLGFEPRCQIFNFEFYLRSKS